MLGVITEKTATRLTFSWAWSHDPDDTGTTVTVEATAAATGSQLRVRHTGYLADDERIGSHLEGWQHFLPKLEAAAG